MINSKTSIQTIFMLVMLGISLFSLLIFISFAILYNFTTNRDSFVSQSKLQTTLMADFTVTPLAFFDKDAVKQNLKLLDSIPNINQAIIFDNKDDIFIAYHMHANEIPTKIVHTQEVKFSAKTSSILNFGTLNTWHPLMQKNQKYGTLYIQYNTNSLNKITKNMIFLFFIFAVIVFIIVTITSKFISKQVLKPIFYLIDGVELIRKEQKYDTSLEYKSNNEIGRLYKALNALFKDLHYHQQHLKILNEELEIRVQERTKELHKIINTLQSAQLQLVESEKMAALGGLVSGLSHEVNTPLGNALTGASIIEHETQELDRFIKENTLKKSILEEKLHILSSTATLLVKTITQAASLIRSFKKISVDQTHEENRKFNLYEYINEIFLTFHNKLKKVPIEVIIKGDESLDIYSYPGVFAQIINNLIQNALMHAFPNEYQNSKITVMFERIENNLVLHFIDNGVGINESVKGKIFEPFVTTKRNEGGTGLGLNIVYNIVAQKLAGTIKLESSQNHGTDFIISIPLKKKD